MQEQNTISINYLENPVRFADLINGYIYHGQERIKPTDISELGSSVARIAREKNSARKLHTQVITADVRKKVSQGMQVAVIALENQTDIHYAMPVRVMNLEAYSLELKEMIADYPMHLLEVRKFENLEVFHTDLQYVFGFWQNEGSAKKLASYVKEHETAFRNLQEDAYDMISVMAHSEELQNYKQEDSVNGGKDMCQAIKEMIETGRAEGHIAGRHEGALQQLLELVRDNLLSTDEAVKRSGISREEFLRRLESV